MPKRIRIIFDARSIAIASPSGVGLYTQGLIKALAREFPDAKFVGHYYNFMGRSPKPKYLVDAANVSYSVSRLLPEKVVNQLRRFGIVIPFELLTKKRGDLHLFPAYLSFPSLFKTPYIVTIHDLSYLNNADMVSSRNQSDLIRFVPAAINKSSLVLAVSESTKKEIIKHYDTDPAKILVSSIPPPAPLSTSSNERSLLSDIGITNKYLLFLGTIEPRKNIDGLVVAFEALEEADRKDYSLVLAGGSGWNDQTIRSAIQAAKAKGVAIIETGYVSEAQKAALYRNATCLILAAHEEGFGMPILEAASYGTPALLSDIPVFREVAGRGALYFDQTKTESIVACIHTFLKDDSTRQSLSKMVVDNLSRYSWETNAKMIMKRFQEILKIS